MGASQSHSNPSSNPASHNASSKTSYYTLLGVSRTATEDELKKAYRRKALELHPDRNYGDVQRTTALFTDVQAAYEVLSDPQERAWYDSHEDAILAGYDPAEAAADGGYDDSEYEHTVGLTSADDIVRVMGRFNRNVEFSDAPSGFYGFLREVFEKLAKEEMVAARREGLDMPDYPSFGYEKDAHEDVVKTFYGVWAGFSTRKTFAWRDKWRSSDAPDRRTRRYVEKENQAMRNEGIREFNDAVRSLVAFVRKRDPRFKANAQSEAEREKALREATAARAAKQRRENEEKIAGETLPEWAKFREPDEVDEQTDEESEEEHYECVACRKTFKSENQWEAHEKSKKHLKAVQALRKKMMKEGVNLDLDEDDDVEQSVDDSAEYPVVDDPSGLGNEPKDTADTSEDEALQHAMMNDMKLNGQKEDGVADIEHETPEASDDDEDEEAVVPRPNQLEDDSNEASEDDNKPVSTTTTSSDPTPPAGRKLGKAAQKRAKKAAQAANADPEDLQYKCASCNAAFPSKTRLFQHLKDHPGHAAPAGTVKGKGGKGKKR